MGLKSAAANKNIVGKFTGQPLTAVSVNFSGSNIPLISGSYVAEDGTTFYVAENGTDNYVTET